jgi:hypothetical protein
MHQADQTYWPQITAMRVKKYHPLDTPVPPPTPELLLNKLLQYASVLFKVEADQYEQLRTGGHYLDWLSRLTDRVVAKVVKVSGQLNDGDSDALLLDYHGLTLPKIEQELKEFLEGIAYQYDQGQFNATVAKIQINKSQTVNIEQPSDSTLPLKGETVSLGQSDSTEVERRQKLLNEYKVANKSLPNKRIYEARNSGLHKPEFYEWLNGTLPAKSETTLNFERFLREKKPPIPRKPKA